MLPSETIKAIVDGLEAGEQSPALAKRLEVDEDDVLAVKKRMDALEAESVRAANAAAASAQQRRARHGAVKVAADTNPFLMKHRAMPQPRRRQVAPDDTD